MSSIPLTRTHASVDATCVRLIQDIETCLQPVSGCDVMCSVYVHVHVYVHINLSCHVMMFVMRSDVVM